MSSYNRRIFLALLAAPLAGCGFTPVYAPQGPAPRLQGAVQVADPDNKNGFDLVERLQDRLGHPEAPRFALNYAIRTNAVGVGITSENSVPRFNLTGTIDWVLSDMAGRRLTGGQVQSFTSYSATGSTVAGLTAEEDAARRLMRILADQIVSRLLATSGQWGTAGGT